MKTSRRAIVIAAAVTLAVVVGTAFLRYNRFGSGVHDPESARCPNPPITTGATRSLHDHVEIDSRFTCEGETLAGTVYLPLTSGRYPGVVWVHGAGEAHA
jgi:hypothetical protein